MDKHLFYALLGGTINVVLSSAVPCLIKKKDKSFFIINIVIASTSF